MAGTNSTSNLTSEAIEPGDDNLARAIRYTRTREWLFLVDLLVSWFVQGALISAGVGPRLARGTERIAGGRTWLADGLFAIAYGLVLACANLPMAYLHGYVVEKRFGLSTQSRVGWLMDQTRAIGVSLALEAPVTATSCAVIRRSPRYWWLILSGLALPVTAVLAQLYPIVIAPLFNRFTPLHDAELATRIRRLAERTNVQIADVVQMDMSRQTRKANAFFAGLGPTRRIALGDTLVDSFSPAEVEVIVAHELGHQVHRDIWKGIGFSALATLVGAFAVSRVVEPILRRYGRRLGIRDHGDVAAAPLLSFLASVISVLALPVANGVSRKLMERPADRYALELTRQPAIFISAMEKLARVNLIDPAPPRLVTWLLHSHPPVRDRIAMARSELTSAESGHIPR